MVRVIYCPLRGFDGDWHGGLENVLGYICGSKNFDYQFNVHYSSSGHCD